MYEKFFGFHRAPFELVPDPDFLFLGESHDSALANLVIGIDGGKGFVAISGPVGAGKTTILRALLRRLGRNQNVCFLTQPETGVEDLLSSVLYGFGVSSQGLGLVELRRRIRELLERSEKPGILIVDEAHLLTEDSLEQIRLLSNLEEENRKLLQIVLSGQPELNGLLRRPRLAPLTQRIEMFYEIEALSLEETRAYIDRRIRVAGNPSGLVFEPGAIEEIHAHAAGIPRLINILADRCLITAYVDECRIISSRIVRDAFDDLGEVTQSVMRGARANGQAVAAKESEPPRRARTLEVAPPPPLPPPSRAPSREAPRAPSRETVREAARAPSPERPPRSDEAPPRPRGEPRAAVPEDGPSQWRVPYLGAPKKSARERREKPSPPPAKRSGSSRDRVDRWFALGGILALVLMAVLSLGSRGLPVILASVGGGSRAHLDAGLENGEAVQGSYDVGSLPGGYEESPLETGPAPDEVRSRRKTTEPSSAGAKYAVHVASFRELSRAEKFAAALRRKIDEPVSISPTEVDTGLWFRIFVGEFRSIEEATEHLGELRDTHGFSFLRPVRLTHPEDSGR